MGYNLATMLGDLKKILQDECQIDIDKLILVAVSGGPDSLCIADYLHREGYQIAIAHYDHKLRQDSVYDAEAARQFAQARGLRFLLGEGKVAERAREAHETIEEAARFERYQFFFRAAGEIGAQAVISGHTADDQVETVLMHFLRGSGLDGMGGMHFRWQPNAWHPEIPLVRPLLGTWREETLSYCKERGLNPVSDPTNQDPAFFRNRLRLELIPYLETYNPSIRKLIWQTAEVLRKDGAIIHKDLDEAWAQVMLVEGEDYVCLDANLGKGYSIGIQRRLVRRAIEHMRPGLRDISFDAVERGVASFRSSMQFKEQDLIAGLKLVSEVGKLWFAEWGAELPTDEWPQVVADVEELDSGNTIQLRQGWQLSAQIIDLEAHPSSSAFENIDPNQAWLDHELIQWPLVVRSREAGDRFHPHGMGGHSQKLSDFMINQKVPRRARMHWPIVCSGDKIVWVAGLRPEHAYRITPETKQALKLCLKRSD